MVYEIIHYIKNKSRGPLLQGSKSTPTRPMICWNGTILKHS